MTKVTVDACTLPVSVVIPCYRCDDTIARALASVARQSARPAEVILVDDYSNDGGRTLAELERLREKYRDAVDIRILALPKNCGAGEARNEGWASATQEFVAFLDADDAWHSEKLAIQIPWMQSHPDYVLSSHGSLERKSFSADDAVVRPVAFSTVCPASMLFQNQIVTRSVVVRRSIRHRFRPGMRYAEDYHLWLRILFDQEAVGRLRAPLAYSYKRGYGAGGLSANLPEMHCGALICFRGLREDRLISHGQYVAAVLYENIKYWRRILITAAIRALDGWKIFLKI